MPALSFEQPERLLLLAVLLPVLLWLARPQRPRRRAATAHLAAWEAALRRLGRRPIRFRALRFWLLAVAVIAVCGASAEPRIGAVDGPLRLRVLLDASASMAAREPDGTSAWERAVGRLRAVAAELPDGVTIELALLADGATVLRGAPADVLAALPPAPRAAPLTVDPVELAVAQAGPDTVTWVLTDGRPGPSAAFRAPFLDVLGSTLANRGIVRVAIDDHWPLPEIDLRIGVAGIDPADVRRALRIDGGDAIGPAPEPASGEPAAAGAPLEVSWRLLRAAGGELRVACAGADPLASDDAVVLRVPPPPAPDVAVLGEPGDAVLQRAAAALAALGGGRVVAADDAAARPQLLVSDGGRLAAPVPRQLAFGTRFGPAPEPGAGPAVERMEPRVADWSRDHWLTAGVDFSELLVRRAIVPVPMPAGAEPLVWADDGPLLWAVDAADGRRAVVGAFRLRDSNLPLLPAFPQLLRRAYVWLCGPGGAAQLVAAGPLDAAESDLTVAAAPPARPLPPFRDPGRRLAVPLLAVALLALAARAWA
ncbi:MAG: hypothetical protein IPM29_17035 [Planctomycetes bacterium]|nr:hypothetical protein [Planctomycetota bacterium]